MFSRTRLVQGCTTLERPSKELPTVPFTGRVLTKAPPRQGLTPVFQLLAKRPHGKGLPGRLAGKVQKSLYGAR